MTEPTQFADTVGSGQTVRPERGPLVGDQPEVGAAAETPSGSLPGRTQQPPLLAEIVLLARKPHVFEERILLPGVQGSYCFYCDETEDGNPLHIDGSGPISGGEDG